MEKILQFCPNCEKGYADRFKFCPTCAARLIAAELKPISETGQGIELNAKKLGLESNAIEEANTTSSAPDIPISNRNHEKADDSAAEKKGITRRWYVLFMFATGFGSSFLLGNGVKSSAESFSILIVTAAIVVFLVYLRLGNIGIEQRWLAILSILPIINILVLIPCLIFQENYYETNKLDFKGKIILAIFVFVIVVPILLVLL